MFYTDWNFNVDGAKLQFRDIIKQSLPANLKTVVIERFTRLVIPALAVLGSLIVVVTVLIQPNQLIRVLPVLVGLLILALSWALLVNHRIILGAAILIGAFATAILLGMSVSGGIRAPIFYGIIPAVVVVTSLFGNKVGLISAISAFATTLFFAVLEMTGNLPQPTPPSTTFIVIIHFGWLFVAFVAIMIPISLMNRALKESEEAKLRAEATLHHSHQLMGLLEPNGNVITINETALSFVDISRSEVVGKPFVETPWWPDEEKPRLSLALSKAAEGEHSAFKTWHMRQDGNKRIIDFCVGPYRDESGDIVYLIAEGRDVTELVKAEEQLAHREKLESVGELAGGIAHDFNNMLGGIIGAAECIATVKNPDDELFQKSLNILFTSSERAAALASKLLVFSRREQGRVEHCDFRNLLDDTAALLEHSVDKRINILVEHTDAETWVEGDTSQLQNVLLNLGINARDAMPDGGQLKMSTRMVQLDAAFCEQHPFDIQPGRYVQLSVSDTGVGMSPEIQKRVFEPFFTTKERGKGTGLGLSMVYGSVVAHKGAITVYSDLGRGTVFHILLPAMNPPGAVSSSPQQKLVFHDQGRVLLIDDEEVIRHTCQAMLNAMGYEVIEATNGLGGISIFEQQHRELKFVIVDMMMPEMNGRETLHRIRQISPEMKVIMMSGFAPDSTIAALRDDGADCFLSKPVHRDDLIQAIKSILSM